MVHLIAESTLTLAQQSYDEKAAFKPNPQATQRRLKALQKQAAALGLTLASAA